MIKIWSSLYRYSEGMSWLLIVEGTPVFATVGSIMNHFTTFEGLFVEKCAVRTNTRF